MKLRIEEEEHPHLKPQLLIFEMKKKGVERDFREVSIDLLQSGKDNAGISSDVASYEKLYEPLPEKDNNTQIIPAI